MLGLTLLFSLITVSGGQTYLNLFRSDGEHVSLRCNNDLTDCTSTSWIYSETPYEASVILYEEGMKKKDIQGLSLGSDCSLNIYKLTPEHHGIYICKHKPFMDTSVHLHVLQVSSSSTRTEIRAGRSFSLSCQLYVHDGYPCSRFFSSEELRLIWVNKAGVDLSSDSRYQISSSPDQCLSTLNTTLLREDHGTDWTCQLTQRNDVKTSVRYTVTYPDTSSPAPPTPVIVGVAVGSAALIALIALWLICKKRAGAEKSDPAEVISTLTPVTPVTPPAADVKTEDVSYAEVVVFTNKLTERHRVQSEETVTYAALR